MRSWTPSWGSPWSRGGSLGTFSGGVLGIRGRDFGEGAPWDCSGREPPGGPPGHSGGGSSGVVLGPSWGCEGGENFRWDPQAVPGGLSGDNLRGSSGRPGSGGHAGLRPTARRPRLAQWGGRQSILWSWRVGPSRTSTVGKGLPSCHFKQHSFPVLRPGAGPRA